MNKNVSVPNPCHEKWDGMQPKENGRYCGSCQKVVTDFTNKTNEEILDYIKQNSSKQVCGTFKNSQLPPTNHYQPNENAIRFLAALLLVFGMTLFSCNPDAKSEKEQVIEPVYHRTLGVPMVSDDTIPQTDSLDLTAPEIITVEEDVETTTGVMIPELIEPDFPIIPELITPVDTPPSYDHLVVGVMVEPMPEFDNNGQSMHEYIVEHIKYPIVDEEVRTDKTVYVSFVVKADGSIDKVKVLKETGSAFEEEALRVVKGMTKWKPAVHKGKPIDVQFTLPIKFRIK